MNPSKLDPSRCCETVRTPGMSFGHFHQCERKWKVKRGGKCYCAIHDPVEVEKRKQSRANKFDKQLDRQRRGFDCLAACSGMKNPVEEVQALKDAAASKALSLDDAIKIAKGCFDYSGGHRDEARETFHHGIQTVVNALEGAKKKGLDDYQVAVLHKIGSK